MSMIPEFHVFVCITNRPPQAGGSCGAVGSGKVMEQMQFALMENDLMGRVRMNGCTCLGPCDEGVNMVVYPEGIFYARVTPDDVPEIVKEHFLGGKPVERLVFTGQE